MRAGSFRIGPKSFQVMRTESLWRYWPAAYYFENGRTKEEIEQERFEDTGHAGITLLSLTDFKVVSHPGFLQSIQNRANFLYTFKGETPRDLDGRGPKGQRWFLAGGWADFVSPEMRRAYSRPMYRRGSRPTRSMPMLVYSILDPPLTSTSAFSTAPSNAH